MRKIPVHIISGFLGAGKTTEIIRILEQKPATENWAIIINEFGKISIDGKTLQSKSAAGSLYEISGGCICCSAKGYFAENLDKIVRAKGYIYTEMNGYFSITRCQEFLQKRPTNEPPTNWFIFMKSMIFLTIKILINR